MQRYFDEELEQVEVEGNLKERWIYYYSAVIYYIITVVYVSIHFLCSGGLTEKYMWVPLISFLASSYFRWKSTL